MLLRRTKHTLDRLRQHGFAQTASYVRERISESYHEWRLGIQTVGNFRPDQLGNDNSAAMGYYPSDYGTIYKTLGMLPIRPNVDGFLDLGCGMGRIVAAARTFPFRTVIGVEITPRLADVARQNLSRARRQFPSGEASIILADAQTYQIPTGINYVFFYSPFQGPILRGALDNIGRSLTLAPRPLTVIFKNTPLFEPLLSEYPWLVKKTEFRACDATHNVMILDAESPRQPSPVAAS